MPDLRVPRLRRVSLLVLLFVVLAGSCLADDLSSAKCLLSEGRQCIDLKALAGWMGLKVDYSPQSEHIARIQSGDKMITVQTGTVLGATPQGAINLQTFPAYRDGIFYVPLRSIVEYFGGSISTNGAKAQVSYAGRVSALPVAKEEAAPGSGKDRLLKDINDPRIMLDESCQQSQKLETVRSYVDGFNSLATPALPTLNAVSGSKILTLFSRLPVVGSIISGTQTASTLLAAGIKASNSLAQYDEATLAPVRKAFLACKDVQANSSNMDMKQAKAAWKSAIPALEKQAAQNASFADQMTRLDTGLVLVSSLIREFNKNHSGATSLPELSFTALRQAIAQLLIVSDSEARRINFTRSYFQKLIDDVKE